MLGSPDRLFLITCQCTVLLYSVGQTVPCKSIAHRVKGVPSSQGQRSHGSRSAQGSCQHQYGDDGVGVQNIFLKDIFKHLVPESAVLFAEDHPFSARLPRE